LDYRNGLNLTTAKVFSALTVQLMQNCFAIQPGPGLRILNHFFETKNDDVSKLFSLFYYFSREKKLLFDTWFKSNLTYFSAKFLAF
jgi:hypothetical protein